MPSVTVRASTVAAVLACAFAFPRPARADEAGAAHAAYDRGAAAFARKSYAEAAREFASADELSASDAALSSALAAALLADDAVLGMALVERAEGRAGAGGDVAAAAKRAREKLAPRAGRLHVECAKEAACSVRVDGAPFTAGAPRWVAAGRHFVQIAQAGASADRDVTVAAGSTLELVAPPPPPPAPAAAAGPPVAASAPVPAAVAPPAPASSAPAPAGDGGSGLSPAWFFAGVGLTAAAGVLAVVSGVDTLDKHGQWEQSGDPGVNSAGRAAQTRTNALLAVTGGFGLATLGVGLFGTRWTKAQAPKAGASLGLGPYGPTIVGRY